MTVVHSVEELSNPGTGLPASPAVAIGNLDGVHRGHQALIASACAQAVRSGGVPCVLTFSPHPQEVLHTSSQGHRLTTDAEKFALLAKEGVQCILALKFDAALAALSPETFFTTYLAGGMKAASVHVGDDFRFGKKRSGDTAFLRQCGLAAGMGVHIIPAVLKNGVRVSSTQIRLLLQEGNAKQASELMGRPYRLSGKVVRGEGRGRQLGIPTANVQYPLEKVAPRHGVYATRAKWKGKSFVAITNFGVRPTFQPSADPRPTLETHILGFSENLYGEILDVDFIDWIREERRFDGIDALRAQVRADIETAKRLG